MLLLLQCNRIYIRVFFNPSKFIVIPWFIYFVPWPSFIDCCVHLQTPSPNAIVIYFLQKILSRTPWRSLIHNIILYFTFFMLLLSLKLIYCILITNQQTMWCVYKQVSSCFYLHINEYTRYMYLFIYRWYGFAIRLIYFVKLFYVDFNVSKL